MTSPLPSPSRPITILAVDDHLYPEERHGFRQAGNQAHALECEWCFYQQLLAETERSS